MNEVRRPMFCDQSMMCPSLRRWIYYKQPTHWPLWGGWWGCRWFPLYWWSRCSWWRRTFGLGCASCWRGSTAYSLCGRRASRLSAGGTAPGSARFWPWRPDLWRYRSRSDEQWRAYTQTLKSSLNNANPSWTFSELDAPFIYYIKYSALNITHLHLQTS